MLIRLTKVVGIHTKNSRVVPESRSNTNARPAMSFLFPSLIPAELNGTG
ncbi:hypothetical protein [Paenibacillus alvei]|nr:hypothetical protein [Paenibacillus alvei]MCY9578633.1 hypothetical protein [Paenibacillus alvei]